MESQLHGLTATEAAKRLEKDGPNEVPEPEFNFWKAFYPSYGIYQLGF